MIRNNHKPIYMLIALTAAFGAAPAFAQNATTPTQDASQAATAGAATDAAAQQQQTAPPQTEPQTTTSGDASGWSQKQEGAAKKQGWEEVDTDKDGAISKSEAAANDGLSKIFDQADTDADGKLTTNEYKDFVGKNYGGDKPKTKP